MSCPDWEILLAHRFEHGAAEPEAWPTARSHLESCGSCRSRALAVDPTLVFQLGPAPALDADEVEEMRRATRSLRRIGALQGTPERQGKWRRFIGAAGLAVAALLVLPTAAMSPPESSGRVFAAAPETAGQPVIEGLESPRARVYQWGSDDLSVVMVVDESLDV